MTKKIKLFKDGVEVTTKEQLQDTKVRVTPETSALVQEFAFDLGFSWSNAGKVIRAYQPFLFFGLLSISYDTYDEAGCFESYNEKEITVELEGTDKPITKLEIEYLLLSLKHCGDSSHHTHVVEEFFKKHEVNDQGIVKSLQDLTSKSCKYLVAKQALDELGCVQDSYGRYLNPEESLGYKFYKEISEATGDYENTSWNSLTDKQKEGYIGLSKTYIK